MRGLPGRSQAWQRQQRQWLKKLQEAERQSKEKDNA